MVGDARPRQLVVTCGTSQLSGDHLGHLKKLGSTEFYRQVAATETPVPDPRAYADELWDHNKFKELAMALLEELRERVTNPRHPPAGVALRFLEGRNPFGAEVSTLLRMQQEEMWAPATDHVLVIASPTEAGIWAARLLDWLLRQFWEIPDSQLDLQIVAQLYGVNPVPETAISALAETLTEVLQREGRRPLIVMTGGFKSVVPCLTIFSLVWGIPLVYLFEESTRLQRLHERLGRTEEEVEELWQQVRGLLQEGGERRATSSCLELALKGRLPTPPALV